MPDFHKSGQRSFAAAPTSAPGPDGQCPGNTNDSFQRRLVIDAYGSQARSDDPGCAYNQSHV